MKLEVIDTPRGLRFLWSFTDLAGTPHEYTVDYLELPPERRGEKIIIRTADGTEVTSGLVNENCFDGLDHSLFGDYPNYIRPEHVEAGWTIEFKPRPAHDEEPEYCFERKFISGLFGLDYDTENTLYVKKE